MVIKDTEEVALFWRWRWKHFQRIALFGGECQLTVYPLPAPFRVIYFLKSHIHFKF